MRVSLLTLVASALFCLLPVSSQAQAAMPPVTTTMDGGANEVLQSIAIPPRAGAPFSGVLHTEWARGLSDGGTVTIVNQRRIARDSAGRIYQERWYLVPKNGKVESMMSHIQISDPSKHISYNCFVAEKRCQPQPYDATRSVAAVPFTQPSGPLPNGDGNHVHESLGTRNISGVEASGSRETTTLNAWVMGNDRSIKMEREFWYSPALGINLLSIVSDPRLGTQTFSMTGVSVSEPEPRLFEIPEGYQLMGEMPSSQTPEN